jgi:hypothetical protein
MSPDRERAALAKAIEKAMNTTISTARFAAHGAAAPTPRP